MWRLSLPTLLIHSEISTHGICTASLDVYIVCRILPEEALLQEIPSVLVLFNRSLHLLPTTVILVLFSAVFRQSNLGLFQFRLVSPCFWSFLYPRQSSQIQIFNSKITCVPCRTYTCVLTLFLCTFFL